MLKTGAQYIESIKAMRPNIYKWGKLIEDVTTNPATKAHVECVAKCYDAAFDPEKAPIYTNTSALSGQTAHRWNTLMATAEDVAGNAHMKRDSYHMNGSCTGTICAGWTVLNAHFGPSKRCDEKYGTHYHENLRAFLKECEDNAYGLAGCLTDAKGNRALTADKQPDKNAYLHFEKVDGGIKLNGYKIQICGVAGCNYIVVMPTTGFGPDAKEFAVVAATPRDSEGITIVETRRPSDTRAEEEGWDGIKAGTTQAFIIFEDVFVPDNHVFLAGENEFAAQVLGNFTNIYRAAIGSCVGGQGDLMAGAAIAIARANGLTQKAFQDKLTNIAMINNITIGLGLGAIMMGHDDGGVWIPDTALAHTNKVQVGLIPYEAKRLAVEIAGGIAETGCIPSYIDMTSPIYGDKLMKSMDAGSGAEDRIKLARLMEWINVGAGIPGCMHGGGSPDTARMLVKGATPWEYYVNCAKKVVGIPEDHLVEAKKK